MHPGKPSPGLTQIPGCWPARSVSQAPRRRQLPLPECRPGRWAHGQLPAGPVCPHARGPAVLPGAFWTHQGFCTLSDPVPRVMHPHSVDGPEEAAPERVLVPTQDATQRSQTALGLEDKLGCSDGRKADSWGRLPTPGCRCVCSGHSSKEALRQLEGHTMTLWTDRVTGIVTAALTVWGPRPCPPAHEGHVPQTVCCDSEVMMVPSAGPTQGPEASSPMNQLVPHGRGQVHGLTTWLWLKGPVPRLDVPSGTMTPALPAEAATVPGWRLRLPNS